MSTPTSTNRKAPAAPRRPATAAEPAGNTGSRRTLEQALEVIQAGEVMTPEELYSFLESLRSLAQALAFFTHAGAAQLTAAARKAARDRSEDGRLTRAQKRQLKVVLVRMGRQLNSGSAEALLDAASGAVKSWALMEDFLDDVESASVQRPHRTGRGGFSLGGN
jgi:hypothetical protein